MAAKKPTSQKTVRKKSPPRKKTKKRTGKKVSVKAQLVKSAMGVFLLLALVVVAGVIFHYLLPEKNSPGLYTSEKIKPAPRHEAGTRSDIEKDKPAAALKKTPPKPPVKKPEKKPEIREFAKPPKYEIFPEKDFSPPKPVERPPVPKPPSALPRVAIIIDDLGYDPRLAEKFIRLDRRFTFAVIPSSPFHGKVAEKVLEKGGELMLHLPMEPLEYPGVDPGPGALLTTMSPDELIEQLKKNLDSVAGIKGVNGHMGSRLTGNSDQVRQVFSILKRRNLYFVDSFTTPDSVCAPSAKLFKIPFAQRDVFIDHRQDADFVRSQLRLLVKMAQKHGEAIGIGHPHKVTIEVLEEMLPEIRQKVELTPVSNLVRIIG